MDSARLEAILGSPLLWGFIGLFALAASLSGKLDMTAAKWVLAVAWLMAIVSLYRFDPIQHLPVIPRTLWIAMLSAAIGLVLYYVSMWMAVKPGDVVSQQLVDIGHRITKLNDAIVKSPSVDPGVQVSILLDELQRISEKELTKPEKDILLSQALTLHSLEKGRKEYIAAAEREKRRQELADREREIRQQQAAQLDEGREKKFASRYVAVIDYVIATLYETLSNIAKESSEPIFTDFPGDRPSIYNSTVLRDGKLQNGIHIIRVGSHKEWEISITSPGANTDEPIARRSFQFQISAGRRNPFARSTDWYSVLTVSSAATPVTTEPVKLNVKCIARHGAFSSTELYSESCSGSEYQKPIQAAIGALIQDRYNACPLGKGAPALPSITPGKEASPH
jgi:hypothetical protein